MDVSTVNFINQIRGFEFLQRTRDKEFWQGRARIFFRASNLHFAIALFSRRDKHHYINCIIPKGLILIKWNNYFFFKESLDFCLKKQNEKMGYIRSISFFYIVLVDVKLGSVQKLEFDFQTSSAVVLIYWKKRSLIKLIKQSLEL